MAQVLHVVFKTKLSHSRGLNRLWLLRARASMHAIDARSGGLEARARPPRGTCHTASGFRILMLSQILRLVFQVVF